MTYNVISNLLGLCKKALFEYSNDLALLSGGIDGNVVTEDKKGIIGLDKELYSDFNNVVSITEIVRTYRINEFLVTHFPTVFKSISVTIDGNISALKEFQFNIRGVYYEKYTNNYKLKSVSYRPIVLLLFFINEFDLLPKNKRNEEITSFEELFHQIEHFFQCSLFDNNEFNIIESKTLMLLQNSIRNDFKYGEMLDFIDRSYDLYKHLFISPKEYYLLFCSFGYATDEIGNRAFEIYNTSRSKEGCWQLAVANYLYDNCNISKELSIKISKVFL